MIRQQEGKVRTAEEKALLRMLGRQLAAWRQEKDLTQEALGEKADISTKYVSELERGRANPTALLLWRVLRVLEVELWEVGFLSPVDKEEESSLRLRLGWLVKNCRGKTLQQAVEILAVLTRETEEDSKGGQNMPKR